MYIIIFLRLSTFMCLVISITEALTITERIDKKYKMCPLRIILIFLSATLAGFFVIRNLRSQPTELDDDDATNPQTSDSSNPSLHKTSKIRAAIESGFWTLVDMASGRYLWRQLVSSSSKRSS